MDQHTGPLRVIRSYDPALDLDKVRDIAEYASTRDPALIPNLLTTGARPTWFHVLKATRKGCRYIRSGTDAGDCYERAFAVCVQRVEGAGGDTFTHPEPTGARAAPDAWLENFDEMDIQEVGSVALNHSFLARDLPRFFPRPDTSESALIALLYHRAGQTTASGPDSPDSSSEPADPLPDTPQP